jgi:two-component system sensor histidine kinase/response regulator
MNARIALLMGVLVLATASVTTLLVNWTTRRFTEDAIGDQMIVQARIAAHLVAIAERAGLPPVEINAHFLDIARFAREQRGFDYEFWVTDSAGKVYLGTENVAFTFTADQPQASEFLPLIQGGDAHADAVVQDSRRREVDPSIYKYAGVSGVDKPRIVQVGYRSDSLLAQMAVKSAIDASVIAVFVLIGAVVAYWLLRRVLTVPLQRLIHAAREVESDTYRAGSLATVSARGDELGHLARVFEGMVGRLSSRYESLVNSMRSVVLKVRGDGVISFANAYATELLGYANAELVGQPLARLLPPEWQDSVKGRLESLGAGKAQSQQVNENVSKSGERFWIAWTNRVIEEGSGSDKETLCVGNDVTAETKHRFELEKREAQIKRANFLSDVALQLTNCGYWHIDYDDPDYYFQSDRAVRILGEEPKPDGRYRLRDEWFSRLLEADPVMAQRAVERYQGTVDGRYESYDAVYKYKRPADGRVIWLHAAGSVVRDETGKARSMHGVYQDITEFKRLEESLRDATKKAEEATVAKSAFLANMSHEIRTPMNGIMGMTDLALDTHLTDEQRDYLNTVKGSADALLSLINDILDFSKIEAGRIELDPVEFLLRDSIADTLSPLSLRASSKGVELAYDVHADVPDALIGDVYRLRQVIVNLVGNAIKFTEKGEVVVTVRALGRSADPVTIEFAVRDTGIGISSGAAERLFRPFEQAESSTTRKYGGTGLGLAISRQLVELMGGHIRLESTPGVGSTFIFTTEFKRGAPRPSPVAEDAAQVFAGKTALVVDDNETNRRIVTAMLGNWGLHSVEADSASAALAMLDRMSSAGSPVTLVLTDLHMPEMDGFQLTEAIRSAARYRDLLVMLLTSSGSAGDNARAAELRVAARLLKPVKQSLLLDNLMRVMAGPTRLDPVRTEGGGSPTAKARPLRILLAEDNAVNQKFAVRLLSAVGHDVVVAPNGRDAVERWSAEPFDLVLMDLQMPEMDGLDATREIRAGEAGSSRHVPIIAMTANAMAGDRETCLDAGMDGYVAKPVKKDVLLAEMARVLKGAADGTSV